MIPDTQFDKKGAVGCEQETTGNSPHTASTKSDKALTDSLVDLHIKGVKSMACGGNTQHTGTVHPY